MSLRHDAVRGLKWQVIDIVGRQVISLVVFTMLARAVEPAAFGLISLVGVYLAFVAMFVDQGMSTALVQRKELDPEHLNAAFWHNVTMASIFALGSLAVAGPVSRFYEQPALAPLIRTLAATLVINSLVTVQNALFVREMNFRQPAFRAAISNFLGGSVGVVMALRGFGVWALVGQQLIGATSGMLFVWRISPWRPSFRFSYVRLHELLGVGFSVFGSAMVWFFVSKLDQLTIGRFCGAGILGYYTVGNKIPDLVKTLIHQPLSLVSLSTFSRMQGDNQRIRSALTRAMEVNTAVTFPVFGGLVAIAPTLTPLVFGAAWKPAIPYMQLWSVHAAILSLFIYPSPAILATGGPGKYLYLGILSAAGSGAASLLAVSFGAKAVLVAMTANILVTGVISLFFLRTRIGLSPAEYLRPAVRPAIFSALMAAGVFALARCNLGWPPIVLCAVQIAVGVAAYSLLLRLFCRERFHAVRSLVAGPSSLGQDAAAPIAAA